MACPGGCIGGGGEPKNSLDKDVLKKRVAAIHGLDKNAQIRQSHRNEAVQKLYSEDLHCEPGECHDLLHTHYTDRRSEVKVRADDTFASVPEKHY